jgi:sigma-B regulation protein RsbU (phosphoserine phosphatase)
MNRNDTLVLYTDGVTEALNSELEMFETVRLEKTLDREKQQSPKVITDSLLRDVEMYAGDAEQADDITILVLTYRG